MTIYQGDEHEKIEPIHVVVDREGSEELRSADFGTWSSFVITPTTQAQQLLPQADARLNAYIVVSGSATGFVRIGSRAQVMNNAGGQFFATIGGSSIKYESSQEVWIGSDGVTATINVMTLDHRFA